MNFIKLEESLSEKSLSCVSIIIMNDKYRESLDLILKDYKYVNYFPIDENSSFIDGSNENIFRFYAHGDPRTTYNQRLLDSYRGTPDLTITESLENELALFAYDGGGTYYEDSTDPRKDYASRPLDFWVGLTEAGYGFAVSIDAESVEEAIKTLSGALLEDFSNEYLPHALKVAYFNGERYAITKEQINEILNPVE